MRCGDLDIVVTIRKCELAFIARCSLGRAVHSPFDVLQCHTSVGVKESSQNELLGVSRRLVLAELLQD